MKFKVKMCKSYEAFIEIEADSAEEACEMVSNGDFSHEVEDSYDADLSEESITNVRVYDADDEYCEDPLAEWDWYEEER